MTSYQSLHTPLLGDEITDDEELASSPEQREPEEKAAEAVAETNNVDSSMADADDDSILRYECFIFPFLLFVQFGLALLRHGHDMAAASTTTVTLDWQNVSLGIILLTITISLYRGACADSKLDQHSWLFVFLPEILVNIILVLALLDKITMAYATVLLGGLFLATLGFCATVHFMCCKQGREEQEQDDDNEEAEIDDDDDFKKFDLLIV
jgi:hypothetical protein